MGLLFYFVLVLLLLLLMWRCEYPVWFCSGCVLQYGFGHMIDTGFDFIAVDVARGRGKGGQMPPTAPHTPPPKKKKKINRIFPSLLVAHPQIYRKKRFLGRLALFSNGCLQFYHIFWFMAVFRSSLSDISQGRR